MKNHFRTGCVLAALLLLTDAAVAQPPQRGSRPGPATDDTSRPSPVDRLMAYDADEDDALTKDEVTDRRLHRIIAAVDKNADGKASREELSAYFAEQSAQPRGRGMRGRGGPAGPPSGNPGPAGPGGPPTGERRPGQPPEGRRFAGPPRPGQVLPAFLQEQLNLTETQRDQIAALQKHVDAELQKILTAEQNEQMQQFARPREGRGFGPPGPGSGRQQGRRGRPPIDN